MLASNVAVAPEAGRVSVSPSGQCVAWAPKRDVASAGAGARFLTIVRAGRPPVPMVVPGYVARDFAVSDDGSCILALADWLRGGSSRLLIFRPDAPAAERDLTELVGDFPVEDVAKISISVSGRYAALSSNEKFAVLDTDSRKILQKGAGRLASLSPSGDAVAVVVGGGLIIRGVSSQPVKRLIPLARVSGVGAWSPDGRYVLVGAFTSPSFYKRLVAVDSNGAGMCELATIVEGDDGSRSAWIRRELAV